MNKLVVALALCCCILGAGTAFGASGHYTNGVEGIKAATLPPPGVYWRMYNAFYNADSTRTNTGKKAPGDFDLSAFAWVNRLIWSTDVEILGGNLIMDVIVPMSYTDLSYKLNGMTLANDDRFGLGDIMVEPFVLGWHGSWYDAAVGTGLYMPTGDFGGDRAVNPGMGFWTFMFTAGGTVYFDRDKTWSASVLSRYEVHTEQEDTDITPGNHFHFEWGVGKTLWQVVDVGVAGYCHWQVTDDSGPGATDDREEAYAAGPEIAMAFPEHGFQVSLRSLWEFENRNRPEGNITTLTLTKAF